MSFLIRRLLFLTKSNYKNIVKKDTDGGMKDFSKSIDFLTIILFLCGILFYWIYKIIE